MATAQPLLATAEDSLPSSSKETRKDVPAASENAHDVASVEFEKAQPGDFELLEQLGKGSFGKVFKVKHKASGEVYAMKTLQRTKLESGNLMRYAITERNVMAYVRHPYIVSLRYAFQTEKQFVLVMTYCSGGNMQQLLKREKRLSVSMSRHYSAQILLGLGYLHGEKILYRDLKPENIVHDDDRHAMITDFGLSKEAVEGTLAKSFLGSICYLAPEILERSGHTHTVDIYGLGVVTHNMLTGRPPFFDSNRKKMWENIRRSPLIIPEYVPVDAGLFIEETMRRVPTDRPGAERTADVQQHVFFQGVDFEALQRREIPVPELRSQAAPVTPTSLPQDLRRSGSSSRPKASEQTLHSERSDRTKRSERGGLCLKLRQCFRWNPVRTLRRRDLGPPGSVSLRSPRAPHQSEQASICEERTP